MAITVFRISPARWHRGPRGVAPERMPKADATELAPKKIGYNPPAWRRCAGGVIRSHRQLSASLSRIDCVLPKSINPKPPFSLVKLRAEALGYKTRRSPSCFCRALLFMVFDQARRRDTVHAYTAEHPIPPARAAPLAIRPAQPPRI